MCTLLTLTLLFGRQRQMGLRDGGYVGRALEADLDADGDGAGDSVSRALAFTAVPARIVGYSPEP